MKYVINTCHGGFSLSALGIEHYTKLKGLTLVKCQDEPGIVFYLTERGNEDSYFDDHSIDRADPALVQTVEDLGLAANGWAASLKVFNIPAGTRFRLQEYDGREWIETEASIDWQTAT